MSATENNTTYKEGTLTTYRKVVNYLLENYETDNPIAKP